jgi:hypothetical protein
MNYDVGQILYVISSETQRIVPMLVCEEIRRRTASGEEVSYLVRQGAQATTFDLKSVNGIIHRSIDEALTELRNNFEQFLQQQSSWTVEMQRVWYQHKILQPTPNEELSIQNQINDSTIDSSFGVPSYEELALEANKRIPK